MRILISILLFAVTLSGNAQIRSGSFQIDGDLNQINVSANADFGQFRSEMSVGYNVSHDRIDYFHAGLNMAPADIYFALELSRVCHRPVDDVIRVYKLKKAQGWGEIAKELGIKPGSAEFHALKNSVGKKSGKYKEKGSKGKGGSNGKKGQGNSKEKGNKH